MKKIELTAPHQHGGRDYPVGAELELNDADADWLIALEKAQPVGKSTHPGAENRAPETTTKEKSE